MKTIWRTPLLSIFLLILLIPVSLATGIGISPAEVAFRDVLFGGYAERLVTVSNPDSVQRSYFITVEGQVSEWMQFDPGVTFSVPARSSRQVIFIISPPDDVSSGTYTGAVEIVASQASQPSSQYGMGIRTGARIPISISVTGQEKKDYEVFPITGGTGGGGGGGGSSKSSFHFSFDVINKGNVNVTPQVHVDVWDRDQTKIVKSADFQGEAVLPTKQGTQEYELLTKGLKPGQYWADITVTIDGKVVKQQLLTFDVYKKDELPVGEIVDVFHKVRLYPDEVARVDFVFENKGLKTTSAVFRGSVFFQEQSIEDVQSEEVTAYPGNKVNLTVFFKPDQVGQYIVKGKAYYSDKVTYPVDTVLNVVEGSSPPDITGAFTGISSNPLALAAITIVLVYIAYRFFTRPKEELSQDLMNLKKATSAGKPKTRKKSQEKD